MMGERGDFGERQKQLISKRLKHMFSNPPAKLSPSPHLPSTSQGRPGPTLDNQVDKFWEVHQRNFFVQFPHIFLEVSRIASSAILGSHHRSPSTSKILVHTTSTNIHVGDGSEWCSQPRRKTSGRKKWKWYWQDSAYCALHRNVGMPICMKMGSDSTSYWPQYKVGAQSTNSIVSCRNIESWYDAVSDVVESGGQCRSNF